MSSWTFTSESVTEGHPDKMADQISDAILDAMLEQDPMSRVACETFVTTGLAIVGGEITTRALFDVASVVRNLGNVDAEFAKGGTVIEATYYTPMAAHAAMEPPAGLRDTVPVGTRLPMRDIPAAANVVQGRAHLVPDLAVVRDARPADDLVVALQHIAGGHVLQALRARLVHLQAADVVDHHRAELEIDGEAELLEVRQQAGLLQGMPGTLVAAVEHQVVDDPPGHDRERYPEGQHGRRDDQSKRRSDPGSK